MAMSHVRAHVREGYGGHPTDGRGSSRAGQKAQLRGEADKCATSTQQTTGGGRNRDKREQRTMDLLVWQALGDTVLRRKRLALTPIPCHSMRTCFILKLAHWAWPRPEDWAPRRSDANSALDKLNDRK
ncbi:unnamed protein product [Ectocarpus sp. 12 AP-2014]